MLDRSILAGRNYQLLAQASFRFFVRASCFLLLMFVAERVPGWTKGPFWLAVFLAGLWTFPALIRECELVVGFLILPLRRGQECLAAWSRRHEKKWKVATLICAFGIAAMAICRAWPTWHFMGTTSLRQDEILNIARYTSRGFVSSISTYSLARNHIFYNILSTALPGADSTAPLRARLVSFFSVGGALVLLTAYAGRRGWLLAGVACAGLVAGNLSAMRVVLEARGYGLIFLWTVLACVAFAEWMRTHRPIWLKILAISCVLGTYTLPFYVVFGGLLLLLAFCYRPSRETFLSGLISLAAIVMLYLPIMSAVHKVFSDYSVKYAGATSNYSIYEVFLTLQYFFPEQLLRISAFHFIVLTFLVLLFVAFGRFATASDRLAVAGVSMAILGFLSFCLFCRVVPMRVSAYLAGPLAFLGVVLLGSVLSARSLLPFRPLVQIGFSLFAVAALSKSEISQRLTPSQNWRDMAALIERAFPRGTRVWTGGSYSTLLQWNLSSRKRPEEGPLDQTALRNGELVAVEDFFRDEDKEKRLRWEDLPEGVRFVTIALSENYGRVFFLPPTPRGIASIRVNNRQLAPFVLGRQPYDPLLLAESAGHGDVLHIKDTGNGKPAIREMPVAQPVVIPLPAVMTVELDRANWEGTCNLLFSQSLEDKSISAELRSDRGGWHASPNVFILGELASIALDRERCDAVRIHIDQKTLFSNRILGAKRPPFGLIDAWTPPYKAGLL